MKRVNIFKLPTHGVPDLNYCWGPMVNGRILERGGEPCRSIRAAKNAAADALGVPRREIEDQITFKIIK